MAGLGSFFLEIGVDQTALQKGLNAAESRLTSFSGKLERVGTTLSIAVSAPLALIGKNSIKAAADFETLEVSFGTMLKSMDKGRALMKDLQKYNLDTPFQSAEVNNAAKSLLAYGFAQNQIIPQLKMIGDLSAGVGIPIKELADIYGKARVQGRLFGEDINQIMGRGINIVAEFANQFKVPEEAIKKMTEDGKISFANLEKAFESMTQKGGQFYNMTANQSKTLAGIYSNFQDSVSQNLKVVGDSIVKNLDLKTVVPQMSKMLGDLAKSFSELSPQAQKAIVIIGGLAVVLPPLLALAGTILPAIATGFTALISPAGLAATALVGAAGLIIANWDKVSESIFRVKTNLRNAMLAIGMTFADIQGGVDPSGASEMRNKLLKSYYESAPEDKQAKRFSEQAQKNYDANRRLMFKKGRVQSVTDTESLGNYYEQKDNFVPPPPPPPSFDFASDAQIKAAQKIAEETKKIRLELINDTQNTEISLIKDKFQREKAEAQKRYNDDVKAKMESIQGKKGLEDEYANYVSARYKSLQSDLSKIADDEQMNLAKMLASRKGIRDKWADVVKEYFDRTTPENDKAPAINNRMEGRLQGLISSGVRGIQSESDRTSIESALGVGIDIEKWKTDSASYIDAANSIVQANARIKNSLTEIGLAAGISMGETVAQMMMGTATITDLANSLLSTVGQVFADMLKQMAMAEAKMAILQLAAGNPAGLFKVIGLAAAGGLVGAFSNKVGQGRANNQQQRQGASVYGTVLRGSDILASQQRYETIKAF